MEVTGCSCTVDEHMSCAGRVPIFSSLNKDELRQVVSLIVQRRYEKDSLVISEGSVPQNFIVVSRGKIKVYGYSQDGKEQIMYILTNGDFFGARNLIHDRKADFNAQAMEDTVVCMIQRQKFQELLLKFPSISIKIMDVLCDRLEKMESMFRKISPKDVDSRVNMMLLELSQKYGRKQDNGTLIELPMSREEMANYIGVARETVSRKITLLKDEGIIEIMGNRKILIVNEEALESSI
ncbi:MAG TPA: Crp/Fnr family transcriptional regulator [Pseudobacteroides sp.]|uniref:Crp/Fnr family transcriptional regulator n=1 Tax=Pseudobacteroides sp. TaxID=1968840 RepID=UPI002F93B52F